MPTVLREAGYRFHFFSGDGHEPPHVHIDDGDRKAKIWLQEVRVAKNGGFSDVELGRIIAIVSENRSRLLEAWNEFFA
ncbi:DUF4160 domain-containing protein [Mesorhizobium sp. BAC0120]|uniref:DUF4160 domain-containing protein n=1 Tax=Mesorhizobium sp. BAC0120 TaxID=3090670 RepID=UPI00298C78D4|nr:DUF4160 domain-containing protein [Mesorhizobium sp. BAC0120]MDW6024544.1 DUF4160 domain-containing protein [Mesorhizobium sp. BAC0120]